MRVRINTDSPASTDNLQAFSGYRSRRRHLLDLGLDIYEYGPDPEVRRRLMQRTAGGTDRPPVFALHAKTMVPDDPRSQNLDTEVGAVIHSEAVAREVQEAIETDMPPENCWNAASDAPDRHAPFARRSRARFWQLLPIKPLLYFDRHPQDSAAVPDFPLAMARGAPIESPRSCRCTSSAARVPTDRPLWSA